MCHFLTDVDRGFVLASDLGAVLDVRSRKKDEKYFPCLRQTGERSKVVRVSLMPGR